MAIIYSYPTATPKTSDLLIGTVTYDGTAANPVDGNPTRTFSIGDVADLVASYTLTSKGAGTSANIILTRSSGGTSVVNLIKGAGVSISDNGSNAITLANTGVLSIVAANSTFVSSTPVLSSTGNVTISSSLSAIGTPTSSNYLRGDNRWSTPVTTITTQDSQYINLTPNSASNGAVTITAELSAIGSPSSLTFLRGDNVWAVPAGGGTVTSVNAGIGIAVNNTNPSDPVVSNTGVLSNIAGVGISINNATGNSTITNTAPDQTVVITGSGGATITGTYPTFNVDAAPGGVTSLIAGSNVTLSPASGIGDVTVTVGGGGSIMSGFYVIGETGSPIEITDNNTLKFLSNSSSTNPIVTTVSEPSAGNQMVLYTWDLGKISTAIEPIGGTNDYMVFTSQSPGGGVASGSYKVLSSNIPLNTFGAATADISIGNNKITNVVNPTAAQDAATKSYVDNAVVGGLIYQGGYDAATNTPVLDSRGTQLAVTKGWTYTVTVNGTFYGETVKVGDVLIAETDLAAGTGALTDWTTVQSNIDLATAGTSATAVRGLAGFDTDNFTVVDGFVNLKVGDIIPSNIVQSIVAGTGITVDNTDPENPIVTNDAPDQIVAITGSGGATVTGTYPNFDISAATAGATATSVRVAVKNTSGGTLVKGTPVYITGTVGATETLEVAAADAGDPLKMPALGLLLTDLTNNGLGFAITGGLLTNITTDPIDGVTPLVDQTVYVKVGGGLTTVKPTGVTGLIQNIAKVGKVSGGNSGSLVVSSILRTNDVPNLAAGRIWVGDGNTTTSTVVYLDEINNRLGLNNIVPAEALDVTGNVLASGSLQGSSIIKTGGTSAQFLKADGSVDSNTYLTTAVTSLTASNGSFINLTPTTSQTGAATLTGDLSATGTPDATTFLRGDNAWVTVAGTTYDYSSIQSGDDVNLNLTPSSGTVDTVKLVAGSGISLTDDGSNNVTIAASSSSSIAKDDFVGDGTTVAFTLSVTPFSTLFTSVYIAGVYQEKETYSITGTTLTFTTAPPNNGSVEVMSVVVSNITPGANTITRNDFTGTGSQTDYTLTVAPSSINFVDVYVSGTYQNKDTFTIVGTTLSFSEAPANSDEIEVIIISNVSLVQNEIVNYGVNTISTSTTASKNNLYVLTADLTLTLPASPANGDSIKISNLSGVATCILGRNGSLIMGVASDLTLDTPSASFELVYSGATKGWVIVGL